MKGGRITVVNVLRIGERDYRQFLEAWASWLRQAGVTAALNERAAAVKANRTINMDGVLSRVLKLCGRWERLLITSRAYRSVSGPSAGR
jgi:hypothetical protein